MKNIKSKALFPLCRRSTMSALALALLLAPALAVSPPAFAQAVSSIPGSITMEGRGTVAVTPDMAVVTASVVKTAKTADEALTLNSTALANVLENIKAQGIAAKDIQTSGFGIYPRYERVTDGSSRQPNITGYEVRNGVAINIRDLAKLGNLLSLIVENGANAVDGLRFEVSNPQEKLDEARREAVKDAMHKAEIFATAAGVEIGDILSITDAETQMPRPVMVRAEALMAAQSVPVEAGETTISANITIRWSLIP